MDKNANNFYGQVSPARLHKLWLFIAASLVSTITTNAMASDAYLLIYRKGDSGSSSSYESYNNAQNRESGLKQPKIRWYRYYDSNGQASLSNTLTEQQMKYGYEALDKNMQVVKRVAPYSAEQYAIQKAQRDAMNAKKDADKDLKKAYGSSRAATTKRDQILADMTSRRSFLSSQLTGLQTTLSGNIAQAANLERQQKPIPPSLQKSLAESRQNVNEAEQNIAAIDSRQQQVRAEYEVIIRRLAAMERGE